MGICVVRLTTTIQIKYDTHKAYNTYTVLCTVNLKIMIFGIFPVEVVILMITTSLNVSLATDKDNKRRWVNIICSIVGFIGIMYCSVYSA